MYARHYYELPTSAMKATYEMVFDRRVDVQMGDIIKNVTLRDNVTVWPGDIPADTYEWHVVYIRPTAATILPARVALITRVIFKGPTHQ
jgi:hypothetical protein